MKKTGLRKMLAIVMAAAMCLSLPGIGTYASAASAEGSAVAPANIIIIATDNYLEWVGTNVLECYGSTDVPHGYESYVKVELQRLEGSTWRTIKTWTDQGGSCATVCQNYAVLSNYDYRLKITHKAYDGNGNLIETITKYSNIV